MTDALPPGWVLTTLGEVFEIVGGATPSTSEPSFWGGDIPWLTPDDLASHDGIEVASGRRSITVAGYDSASTHFLPQGAVLFSSRAPIGYAAIAAQPLCTNQGFKSLIPPEGVDSRYVYWYLRHATPAIREMGSGTTFKEMSKKRMASVPFVLAPRVEQQRIVAAIEEHFSRLDAADASLSAAELRCQAVVKSILVGAVPDDPPPAWRMTTVGEAGVTGLGRQRSPKYHSGLNMKPYLRVANVFEDRIDASDVMEMHFDEAEFEKYRLEAGDVLLNEGQSPEWLGRPAIYRDDPTDVAFTNSLIRFVPGPDVTSEWALLVFRRHMHAGRFMQESRITTNIAHLALGRFRSVEFPIPPLEVQGAMVASTRSALDSVARILNQIRSAAVRVSALRRSVLAEAFTGRLVSRSPDGESASVMLEGIGAGA
ncbi:MAG: restriction endonuclease subunit S [Acidimicrobiales bacterium]|nr:restriction endonuclease subunit S [Acidimicrobiales bacterium]MYD84690.1 restriction endonuclease subunit S [Acidimicrobiales bacterium]MYJ66502.1 restriction endonuclease subunit S [Acidimicrobiales bacterium]